MKKSIIILGALLLFSVIAITLVSAQALPAPAQLPGFLSDQLNLGMISGFFTDLLIGGSGTEIISRILLVMLLTAVLFQPAFSLVGKKSGLAFLVAFLVSILGIRFFPSGGIQFLLLPYGSLAVAVSAIIPILLFFYLLEVGELKNYPTIRKIAWACLAGAFLFLWDMRYKELGQLSYVYGTMALLAVALLFFDGTIQEQLNIARIRKASSRSAYRQLMDLETDIHNDRQSLAAYIAAHPSAPRGGSSPIQIMRQSIEDKEKALRELYKQIKP